MNIDNNSNNDNIGNQFIHACKNGQLIEAYQILSIFTISNEYGLFLADNKSVFRWACTKGHLKVAQGLLLIDPDINISANEEWAFRMACCNGHLEVAQWLYQVGMDISAKKDFAFCYACANGHLEVVQWLYQIKPDIDISTYRNWAFHCACVREHLGVKKWLLTVRPDKFKDEKNNYNKFNTFILIRDEKEQLWYRMQYLIDLTMDKTDKTHKPHKPHTLYYLSTDIVWLLTFYV